MQASRMVLCILAACCMLGLAHAAETESAMDTIVVIAKRPIPMNYANLIAAEAEAAVADFTELTIAPPQLAGYAGKAATTRSEFALTDEGKTRI